MIVGIGSDIVNIDRIAGLLEKYGQKFVERNFTESEIEGATRFGDSNFRCKAAYFAKRFAAKEAFVKAIGTGFRGGIRIKDISVANNDLGRPEAFIAGEAKETYDKFVKGLKDAKIHLTLSDDYPFAQAMVIIDAN